ncbi:MAG TPA: hypothetical protein VEP90_05185 [Methylomirabilota bacterium]|nr:hypothetical protein [Methylomirabilota bacterium]
MTIAFENNRSTDKNDVKFNNKVQLTGLYPNDLNPTKVSMF